MNRISTISLLAMATLLLSACGADHINVSAQFKNTSDISVAQFVYFNNQQVGEVINVEQQGNGSLVGFTIANEVTDQISGKAAIVINRLKEGQPLEIVNRENGAKTPLLDGQSLKGIDSMMQLGVWMLSDAIILGGNSVSDYVDTFQDYLNSERFENDKTKFQAEFQKAQAAAVGAINEIEAEINRSLKELEGAEQEIADAIDQLSIELEPAVDDLRESSEEIARELELFASSMEGLSESERESSQEVLKALERALERLNTRLEGGEESK